MPADPQNVASLQINHDEEFPNLTRAPIVEAVIQINRKGAGGLGGTVARCGAETGTAGNTPSRMRSTRCGVTVQMQNPDANPGIEESGAAAGRGLSSMPVASNMHAGFEACAWRQPTASGSRTSVESSSR